LLLFFFFGCDLPYPPPAPQKANSAKIITLQFEGDFSGKSENWTVLNENSLSQIKFNINNYYYNIDSVVFKASLRSEQQNVRCFVELFNITEGVPIAGSTLTSKIRYQLHSVRSENVKFNLPAKDMVLGVRVRSERNSNYIEARNFLLLLYYH